MYIALCVVIKGVRKYNTINNILLYFQLHIRYIYIYTSRSQMPRQTKFKEEWLSNPDYKGWLKKKNLTEAMGSYCFNKIINVENMGESA